MTPTTALLLGVTIGMCIVVLGQFALVFIGHHLFDRVLAQLDHMLDLRGSIADSPVIDDEDDEPQAEVPALPVDLANPPVSRIYNPRPGSESKYCSCHHRQIQPGDEILWWPNPETGGILLICQDGVKDVQPV